MPALREAKYDPNDMLLNNAADDERKERNRAIGTYWDYYNGNHKLPLKVKPEQADDNTLLNLCAIGIEKEAAFTQLQGVEVPGEITRKPGRDGKPQKVKGQRQETLEEWLEFIDFPALFEDIKLSGYITGHTILKLFVDPDDDQLKLALIDPRMFTGFWLAGDTRKHLWYRLQWQVDEGMNRRQDIVPNKLLDSTAPGWQIIEYEQGKSGQWAEIGRDEWEYEFSPIVHWKNAYAPYQFYGTSDLTHYHLNDRVNFTASNIAKIIRVQAHKKFVVTGGELSDEMLADPDAVWEFASPDVKASVLEGTTDLSAAMAHLQELRSTFFTQMRVVDLSTIKDRLGQITNFGVKMLFSDMSANIQEKQRLYGSGICEALRRALMILTGSADVPKPQAHWQEVVPENRVELLTAIEKEHALGILSIQTASDDLGRDYETEQANLEQERERSMAAMADSMLGEPVRGVAEDDESDDMPMDNRQPVNEQRGRNGRN